jgi:hypothetical protein
LEIPGSLTRRPSSRIPATRKVVAKKIINHIFILLPGTGTEIYASFVG